MSPKNPIADYKLPAEHQLGVIVVLRVPDAAEPLSKIIKAFKANDLPTDALPKKRAEVNVFEKACASVATSGAQNRNPKHRVEVKVDRVENTGSVCSYQITRMVWDLQNRQIDHPKAMRVSFDKGTSDITVHEFEDYDALRGLEERIRDHFSANTQTIPGSTVRRIVREMLEANGGQKIGERRGLYYMPKKYERKSTAKLVDGVANTLDAIYGAASEVWVIPIPAEASMREMIATHFALNVTERVEDMTQRALNALRADAKRGPREDFKTRMFNERRKLARDVTQFEQIVGTEFKDMERNLSILDDALVRMNQEGE